MLRVAATKLGSPATCMLTSCTRGMAVESLKGFKEAESARENQYFTKEDERVLAKLYSKVKSQANVMDEHAAAGVRAAELSELKSIVKKYDVSSEDVEKLLKWKHTQY